MTLIIAEAGVNHCGDLDRALEMVDVAAQAGADVIKFQTFKAETLVSASAPKAEYQTRTTGGEQSQLEMLKALEIDESAHVAIKNRCEQQDIEFLSTAFDSESLDMLVNRLGIKRLKIPSGEITNLPFIIEHAKSGLPIILSTGMSTLADIEQAVRAVAAGYKGKSKPLFDIELSEITKIVGERLTILHCTSEYPTPPEHVNLAVMNTLRDIFSVPIGYSDHTLEISVPVAAVGLGAKVIEKHFTLDRNLPGPDHQASLLPDQFTTMCAMIREVEIAIGSDQKQPTAAEMKTRIPARKSLVASKVIEKGETLSLDNMSAKRPGDGVSPADLWRLEGVAAQNRYEIGQPISPEEIPK